MAEANATREHHAKAKEFLTDPKHAEARQVLGDVLEGIAKERIQNAPPAKKDFLTSLVDSLLGKE